MSQQTHSVHDPPSQDDTAELRRYAAEMERLFSGLPEGVALLDPDDRVIRVNPAFTRLFGYTAEEAVGRSLADLIVPETRREEARFINDHVLAGESVSVDSVRLRKGGQPVEVSVLGTPMQLEGGAVAVYGIYRDISGQKRAEAELAAAAAHYRRMFAASPVGIYALDGEGRFTEVNPAAETMVGRAAAELVGRHFSEVVAPEDLEVARERVARIYAGERGLGEMDLNLLQPDGSRRIARVQLSAVDEDGVVRGIHGIASDVTEERARARFIHRAERLATVGTLLSGVAHELNNPLNAIRNFAQLMLLDPREPDDVEALEIIQREADRAAKIVADLRMIARQTRDTDGVRELVDLNEVVGHVVKLRRYTLDTNNIQIVEKLAANLPGVVVSRGEIEQLLLNLLLNAEEALSVSSGDRRITVTTRRTPDGVHVQIADTGPGVRPEHLERIFEPFWTTKAPGEGTGLGLSLVHRIAADHGGEVRVRNEPGSGAVFTLLLPRAGGGEGEGTLQEAELPPPARALRVLLVDDEAPIRSSIARYLGRRGHTVDQAADGASALEILARAADYDVILTDLRMPGLGGEQLLEELRAAGGDLHRRVVVITGDAAHADAARVVEATGAPTLIKPATLQEVARTVEEHAQRTHHSPCSGAQ